MTGRGFQRVETREGRGMVERRGDEKLVGTDVDERKSTWPEYHGNVKVWKGDLCSAMRKYVCEYDHENVEVKNRTGAEGWR